MKLDTRADRPSTLMLVLAFATVYVVWGSTYLAIRFAIETLPPLLMAGVRFVLAGAILMVVFRRWDRTPITREHWWSTATVGCLMLAGGAGVVTWAEQFVSSGMTALIIATVPMWLVVLDWLMYRGPRPTARIVIGLCVGLVGVLTLIGPTNIGGDQLNPKGVIALLLACFLWSVGTLRSKRVRLPDSVFVATGMEALAGGALLLVISCALGEWSKVNLDAISVKSVASLLYLVVFGSLLALSAYSWLVKATTPARLGTYAYVNPVIAMFLGYALANEPMTPRSFVAAAVILFAVALITTSPARSPAESRDEIPVDPARPEPADLMSCKPVAMVCEQTS